MKTYEPHATGFAVTDPRGFETEVSDGTALTLILRDLREIWGARRIMPATDRKLKHSLPKGSCRVTLHFPEACSRGNGKEM